MAIVGVFREAEFSPGRVEDDAAILERTADALIARGFEVRLGDAALALGDDVVAVLAMCQSTPALAILDAAATQVPVINAPAAIRHCYRTETVRLLQAAGVPLPATRLVSTAGEPPADAAPCWVKRGDVHAMAAGDVTFTADPPALRAALATLRTRGIAAAALQEHVDGPVLKFYGIADGSFFRCYTDAAQAPASIDALWSTAVAAAAALGLDVFGGDLVVPPTGAPMLIDLNDWPSFARCRDDAADAIAAYAASRVRACGDKAGVAARGATSYAE